MPDRDDVTGGSRQRRAGQRVEGESSPHVVIIGGGFGGMAAAKALRRAPVRITLIDRRNFHLFQPLLYEVATATLSPADITVTLRGIFSRQRNVEVRLGTVTDVDVADRRVIVDGTSVRYDYLIVAAGLVTSYRYWPGRPEQAPGLKTVEDAIEVRRRFLEAFERAEWAETEEERRRLMTFVVVGAGATGMELAGSMAGMIHDTLPNDFRHISTPDARILLIEAGADVLPGFPPDLSRKARRQVERLGVEVRTGTKLEWVTDTGVVIGGESIETANVFWAGGVAGHPIAAKLGAPLTSGGRVRVEKDCTIAGRPEVFVVGDLAHYEEKGSNITGVAPAAIQMARFAARSIRHDLAGKARGVFSYFDKGMAATIGRAAAVARSGHLRISGFPAWGIWVLLHIIYLTTFRNRIAVTAQWVTAWFTGRKGVRLVTHEWDPLGEVDTASRDHELAAPARPKRTPAART